MNNLIVHPASRERLDHLRHSLPQSLLLSGPAGVGLHTIAEWLADGRLAAVIQPKNNKDHVDSDHGNISADTVRKLYEQTRAKHTAHRIVLIDDADRMSLVAQNAFLKLLEEPGEKIYFILTTHHPESLLPTVRSRIQQLDILPATDEQTDEHLKSLKITEPSLQAKFKFIAAGLPAEMTRLAADSSRLEDKANITKDARDLLQADSYQKILIINKYQSDRDHALMLLDSALSLARRSLSSKPQHSLIVQIDQLLKTRESIAINHNAKLQLMGLVV